MDTHTSKYAYGCTHEEIDAPAARKQRDRMSPTAVDSSEREDVGGGAKGQTDRWWTWAERRQKHSLQTFTTHVYYLDAAKTRGRGDKVATSLLLPELCCLLSALFLI